MVKVSVIVPIFNTGVWLKKCINSIQKQTLSEIEIILVDDGSTDNSGMICDSYAQKDDRIKVIHKKNEGVSIARNIGIKEAQGEYIGFVDSDDWIEPDMYSNLFETAKSNNVSIVMCDATTKYDDKPDECDTITRLANSIYLERNNITPDILREIAGSACRCIYKKQFISDYKLEFPIHIPIAEDRIFNINAMGFATGVYYIKQSLYNRYVRLGSTVSKYHPDMCSIIEKVHNGYMLAVKGAWDDTEAYRLVYEKCIVEIAFSAINMAFYKDSPHKLKGKISEIINVCNNKTVQNAVELTHCNDIRARMIKKRQILGLCIIAIMLNKKYGR